MPAEGWIRTKDQRVIEVCQRTIRIGPKGWMSLKGRAVHITDAAFQNGVCFFKYKAVKVKGHTGPVN